MRKGILTLAPGRKRGDESTVGGQTEARDGTASSIDGDLSGAGRCWGAAASATAEDVDLNAGGALSNLNGRSSIDTSGGEKERDDELGLHDCFVLVEKLEALKVGDWRCA